MDGLDHGNIQDKGKTQLDENHGMDDANKSHNNREKSPRCDSLQTSASPMKCNLTHPFFMPLLPIPKLEDWCLDTSIVLSGTARSGVIGPSIGAVDIGVSKSAYYFCIAVPGVKKDSGEFSCEIRRDGKVCVEGVASTNTISKYSQVFIMKLQQRCPPGPFKIFFTLPGPVDPRLFSASFRPDGIFEGVVAKHEQ